MSRSSPPQKRSPVRHGLVVTAVVATFFLWIKMRQDAVLGVHGDASGVALERRSSVPRERARVPSVVSSNLSVTGNGSAISSSAAKSDSSHIVRQAQELLDHGNATAAAAMLEELMQKYPDNVEALMELAMIQVLDFKDLAKAESLLERIVILDANHRAALNELVLIYGDETRAEQGVTFIREQMIKHPESAELSYALGRMLIGTGHAADAIAYLERGQSLGDIRDQVNIDIAEAALRSGNLDKALESYQKAETYQEAEMERLRSTNGEGLDYAEDRLFATRLDHARALINAGRKDEADAMLSTITGHDEDPIFLGLKNQAGKSLQ